MKRLLVSLDDERYEDLRRLAFEKKAAMADLVRHAIEETFEDELDGMRGRRGLEEHAKDPSGHIATEVPATVCMRCHEAANSPHFDDGRYRPFIVGPGHGRPLRPGEKPHPLASGSGPNEALKASLKGMQ